MSSRTWRKAVMLGAAASLSLTLGAGAPAAQAARPVIVDCLWHSHTRPAAFMLACADGNSRLRSLRWSHWGAGSAVARGVNSVNDCEPYCAAGTFHSYRVLVRLDHPEPWKKHPRLRHYTRMSLTYTNGSPDGFPRTVTYPLWN